MKYRLARGEDAPNLLKIYKPYVEKTAITFEYEVPSIEEFRQRIIKISSIFPYIIVMDDNDKIIGYAYANRYRERKAYDWVVELSIYIDENECGNHVGYKLYKRLLNTLTFLNYQRAYACITYPNKLSHSFHEKFGFREIGVMEKSGYKFNQWWGVEWMDLALQESDEVKDILKITDLDDYEIEEILK
ncbi:GNAT family N-acetyltransferase [Lactovum miscens]|uniref:Phosphinothricin acetyltransferase n=1 Tax=Lactovum miscens TaxID=190387 RepID=A0A841C8W9_9LACT|nr:GNAT family N-acetyltransferase [Lactovum miscens]MBB5888168.1 phosphinothricin acetyltransferase [Lactovum miscens]